MCIRDRIQTLSSPWSSNTGDAFGTSVDASADGTWLYVSAPNSGNVYVYQANATSVYTYANTITVGSSTAAQFGLTVKTTSDGRQVAVSAPYQAVNGVSAAGAVYVFDRSIESFIANGTTYTTQYTIGSTSRVTVNGNIVSTGYTGAGTTTLTFTNAPVVGSLIAVETNKIQLLETLTAPVPKSGAAFGTTTYIAGNDADVYVASPGYSVPGYYSGIVYRFVNQGASYGTITSTNYTPVINTGDNFRINGFNISVTGNTVANVAAAVNSANIPGITAIAQSYGGLTLTSNVVTPYQKLVLSSGSTSLLANLGMMVYNNVQTLQHPASDDVNQYGSQVIASPDSASLVIAANGGSTENSTTFDSNTTTFDISTAIFVDTIEGSGMVYVYGLVNGTFSTTAQDQYVLVQRLQNNKLSLNDQFGYSVAMNAKTMLVGAPGDSNTMTFDPVSGVYTPIPSAGTYYTYNNFTGNVGWDVIEQQSPKVDINSVGRMYLFNANTNIISTPLDYIDPAKGKLLGAAQEDLDFITAYDPAVYNVVGGVDSTPNLANSVDFHWGPEQKTKTWWNTGSMRYVDYEQGDLVYRANNWGRMFPGSKIQVAEWVESDMPPSAYPGPGTALYPDNSAYVVETVINPNSKLATSKYYYWVIDKNTVELDSVHINTVKTIQEIIANPQAQNIPYAAVLRDDTISLHGISTYLSGNSTIFHSDYDTLKNTNVIHSEFQLVQEGNSSSTIPVRIVEKLVDSLSGVDFNGAAVPDTSLAPQSRIGLGVYPNQTLFVDRLAAIKNWVEYVNGILIQYPIVEEFNINALYDSAPLPDISTYDVEVATRAELDYVETTKISSSYVALVLADETLSGLWSTYTWNGTAWTFTSKQSYYTPFYWSKADWYDSTYDSTTLPTHVVATTVDIATLSLTTGDTVKVLNNGNSQFNVYRVNSDSTVSLVGIQNGTIQLNNNLYTTTVAANEIRIIFNAIKDSIFVDTLKVNFNNMFFVLINYILTEQPNVDWAFKTSFISILHKLRKLDQPANYAPDNQNYYEQYINEVKPYRTSIRDYLIDYQGNDEYLGDTSDFDIPSTFISAYGAYRSPNGTDARDSIWLSTLPQYSQWYNNYTFGISEVLVANIGANYSLTPTVTVVGGGGSGAVVNAIVDFGNETITGFEVVKPGSGYTSQPTIFINGTGTGATGYAKLKNHYIIDSLPTTVLTANSNVTTYVGNIITQANTGATGIVYTAGTGNTITLIDTVGTFNTTEYIYSDAANLHTNVTSITSHTQFINKSYNTARNLDVTLNFDRVSYSSNIIAWQPNITVTANSYVSYNSTAYKALANVYSTAILTLSGNASANIGDYVTQANTTANARIIAISSNHQLITVANITNNYQRRSGNIRVNGIDANVRPVVVNNLFDYTKYQALTSTQVGTAADRIQSYYSPTSGMPGKDLAQLMSGVEYPGVEVSGVTYNANSSIFSSNLIYTRAANTAIFSANVTIPSLTVTTQASAVVYTGNVITQAVTGATGTVYSTSTGTTMILTNVVGTFLPGYYLSAEYGNLNTTVSTTASFTQVTNQNLVDFTALNYSTGQPLVLINKDANTEYNLTITSIEPWRILVTGLPPTINVGANLALKYYDFNNPTYLDSIIQSNYTTGNTAVNLDGGAYYDTYSSHAPEELVPGVTYDNLNMLVTTKFNNGSTSATYRIEHDMTCNVASSNTELWPKYYGISPTHTTTLSANLNIADSNIHVTNASVLTAPNAAKLIPGTVFINGEKIVFWGIDTVNNVLFNIRRAVDGTGAPAVQAAGSSVVEANLPELIPGGTDVHTTTWLNLPVGGAQQITDNFGTQIVDNTGNVLTTTGQTAGAVTDGRGLENSSTVQAVFIRGLT